MDTRYPYFEEYMKYLARDVQAARNTMKVYGGGTRFFFDWLLENHRFNDVKRITGNHIKSYRDYLTVARYRTQAIEARMRAIKSFFKFCVDFQYLEDTPFPQYLNLRGKQAMPHLVPTPQEIFRIRLRSNVRLAAAAFFELCLSTGMREAEVMQTYATDLKYGDKPFDMELKRLSPFYAGSITLLQTTHATKNKMPRKVYFSHLAGILLKRHMIQEGIVDQKAPLFPWSDSYLQDMVRALGKGIVERTTADLLSSGNSGGDKQRERGFMDVDLTELNLSDDFKKAIERRQEEENSIESYKRGTSQPLRQKKRQLHPHALRHAFTNFCYYRTPLGTRQDEHNLRLFMGHQGSSSVLSYLKTLPLIQDDLTWNRLQMGKPQDWQGITR